ncbi:LamG domain-containing protein [Haliangium sp.]|uniref:LamG domain-containing protein n=1 Tax=Haliangium sp. TaxID=2663208 RepID=UPI003D0A63FF
MLVGCGEIRKIEADAGQSLPPPPIDAAPGDCPGPLVDGPASCGFSAGDFSGTRAAVGGGITLGDGRDSGEFVSRVFDGGEPGTTWYTLAWATDGPDGVPLPDDGTSDLSYQRDGADMADNVLLLHLDDPALDPGRRLVDGSGRGNQAVLVSATGDPLASPEGPFGRAVVDTLDSYLSLDIDPTLTPALGTDLEFGEGDFTWAMWVKTSEDCTEDKIFMGTQGQGAAGVIFLSLGCAAGAPGTCDGGPSEGRASGFFTTALGGDGAEYCGLTQINDDAWHHLALVKSGHATAQVSLFVDGVLESTAQANFDQPIEFTSPTQLTVGTFPSDVNLWQSEAAYDELAIWRRALSADEVSALYRRGALRVGFQVRACTDPACADDPPFLGPGGSETRLYRASSAGVAPERSVALDGVSGRFLQYRVVLESDVAGDSPRVRRVGLSLEP